jgi:hypothetical protein
MEKVLLFLGNSFDNRLKNDLNCYYDLDPKPLLNLHGQMINLSLVLSCNVLSNSCIGISPFSTRIFVKWEEESKKFSLDGVVLKTLSYSVNVGKSFSKNSQKLIKYGMIWPLLMLG